MDVEATSAHRKLHCEYRGRGSSRQLLLFVPDIFKPPRLDFLIHNSGSCALTWSGKKGPLRATPRQEEHGGNERDGDSYEDGCQNNC